MTEQGTGNWPQSDGMQLGQGADPLQQQIPNAYSAYQQQMPYQQGYYVQQPIADYGYGQQPVQQFAQYYQQQPQQFGQAQPYQQLQQNQQFPPQAYEQFQQSQPQQVNSLQQIIPQQQYQPLEQPQQQYQPQAQPQQFDQFQYQQYQQVPAQVQQQDIVGSYQVPQAADMGFAPDAVMPEEPYHAGYPMTFEQVVDSQPTDASELGSLSANIAPDMPASAPFDDEASAAGSDDSTGVVETAFDEAASDAVVAPIEAAPERKSRIFKNDRSFMQNRELSWLRFNERVLDQGADESVPLLERLNFISIFWSNLREFFMVRVGSLTDLSYIQPPVIDSKTGMTAEAQIKAIHERCRELYPIQESYYEHVRGSLAKEGVRHLRPDDLSDEQRNYLRGLVKYNIEPFLSPQIINPQHPFPHLENGKLYILVQLDDGTVTVENKKKKKGKKSKKDKVETANVVLGLIPLPHQCERIIKLPGRGYQFILLEHAIELFVSDVFSMYKVKHTNVICVTRNADIDANQAGDEQDEDYREHMRRLLKKRARLAPVRLECERPLPSAVMKLMLKRLGLKRGQVYDTIVPLDLSFTWGLGSLLSEKKQTKLSNPPFTPAWPTAFDRKGRIMDQVLQRDVLLSYPYESMDPFVQLLKEAAFDPDVISIKITLYRLASQSQLAEALITAAENGKEVTALFELRARFDEFNNIEWSQRFEQAGCNVIYGFRNYKVHSKICCIARKTPEGIRHITQLGTGNYNEKTAKLYTDFCFITTDERFGHDAVRFFRNMQLEHISDEYEMLCVAPLQIKTMILKNLDHQIELAQQGKPCGAFLKANSITDVDVIEKIAEASHAGVGITLFVRGICCIVPEVKGATENVRVVSIVGRLLEHSRIYCFGTPDDCVIYLSSADLMTRNLNKRVEIAWPLLNDEARWKVLDYIDVCLHDTAKLRELRPNTTYTPLGAFCDLDEDGNPQPSFDAQAALIEQAARAAQAVAASELHEADPEQLLQDELGEQIDEALEEPYAPVDTVAEMPIDTVNQTIADSPVQADLTEMYLDEILSGDDLVQDAAEESTLTVEKDAGEEASDYEAGIEPVQDDTSELVQSTDAIEEQGESLLTDMTVEELLGAGAFEGNLEMPPKEADSEDSEAGQTAASDETSVQLAEALIEQAPEVSAEPADGKTEAFEQAPAEGEAPGTTESVAEMLTQAEQAPAMAQQDSSEQQQPEGNKDFFDEKSRDMEMPPPKKQGFFSRLFNK